MTGLMRGLAWVLIGLALIAANLLWSVLVAAQTLPAVPMAIVQGESVIVELAGADLETVQGYTYRLYVDAAQQAGVVLGPKACQVLGVERGYRCAFPLPALRPGKHEVFVTASNAVGESPKSAPIRFTLVVEQP